MTMKIITQHTIASISPFNSQNHNTSRIPYPNVIPYTKFEHFGFIRFELCSGQTNKQRQTDKQTDLNILPTHADRLCRRE